MQRRGTVLDFQQIAVGELAMHAPRVWTDGVFGRPQFFCGTLQEIIIVSHKNILPERLGV